MEYIFHVPKKRTAITLQILLDHIRGLRGGIDAVRSEVVVGRTALTGEVVEVKNMLRKVERNLTAQIDAIDKRLDELEIEYLPRRIAALEAAIR